MAIPAISRFKISKVYHKVRQKVRHKVCHFILRQLFDNNNFVFLIVVLLRDHIHDLS